MVRCATQLPDTRHLPFLGTAPHSHDASTHHGTKAVYAKLAAPSCKTLVRRQLRLEFFAETTYETHLSKSERTVRSHTHFIVGMGVGGELPTALRTSPFLRGRY